MFLSKCTLKFSDLLSRCSVWIAMGMSPKSLESPHVDGPVARICPIHKGWFIYIIKGWKSVIFKLWRYWSKLPWYRRICNLELSLWISKAYLPRSEDKFSLFLFDLVPWGFQNHTYALRCEKYVFYLCICIHIDLYIYIYLFIHICTCMRNISAGLVGNYFLIHDLISNIECSDTAWSGVAFLVGVTAHPRSSYIVAVFQILSRLPPWNLTLIPK